MGVLSGKQVARIKSFIATHNSELSVKAVSDSKTLMEDCSKMLR